MSIAWGVEWTPVEDAILTDHYAHGGYTAVQAALVTAGFPERSMYAIHSRARDLRRRAARGAARQAPPSDPVEVWTLAYDVIRDFRGLPVTVTDIADLTGVGRERIRRACELLVAGGLVASRRIEGNVTVWYDANAWEAAA